jgi:twitching motility two-component system response regulator PilH
MIQNTLRGKGYQLNLAHDGEEAVKVATDWQPNLIVLDVIMPGKNGFQVCRQLKRAPATKDIKILMLTSKDQESDRFWGMKQGADGYLTKPVVPNELQVAIEKLV